MQSLSLDVIVGLTSMTLIEALRERLRRSNKASGCPEGFEKAGTSRDPHCRQWKRDENLNNITPALSNGTQRAHCDVVKRNRIRRQSRH